MTVMCQLNIRRWISEPSRKLLHDISILDCFRKSKNAWKNKNYRADFFLNFECTAALCSAFIKKGTKEKILFLCICYSGTL